MIPSCTQEQKTDCHMNSHVTPIRNIRGMPFTQLSSDPKHIEITSSRHHLRAERKILNQNKKMLFDEGLESTFSGQFTSSTRLVQLNFSVIPHQRSTTISFKTYTPDLLSVRVFLYQNTPRIWGHAASVCWHTELRIEGSRFQPWPKPGCIFPKSTETITWLCFYATFTKLTIASDKRIVLRHVSTVGFPA